MSAEESRAYGIIDEVIASRTVAEKSGGALLQGEPARIANAEAEGAPVESPEA